MSRALRVLEKPLWKPLPRPQILAFNSKAGDFLIGQALNKHHRSLISVRDGTQLRLCVGWSDGSPFSLGADAVP